MEITYLPCAVEHIKLIDLLRDTSIDTALFTSEEYAHIVRDNFSISAWVNHRCIAAAGIVPVYPGRAMGWAILGKGSGKYMRPITRKVRKALDMDMNKRIEMYVDYDFKLGHKWAKLLGFEVEAERLRNFGVLGQDQTMYVRIK